MRGAILKLISHEDTKTRRREEDALGKDLNVMTAHHLRRRLVEHVLRDTEFIVATSRGLKPAANLRRRYAMIMKCQKSCRRAS